MLKSNRSTTVLIRALGLLPLLASAAMAQSKGYQGQCRAKAKETAKVAFDQCMSFAKDNEAELVRQEYKAKLAKLKSVYEQKLKRVAAQKKTSPAGGVVPSATTSNTAPAVKTALSNGDAATTPSTTPVIDEAAPATNSEVTRNGLSSDGTTSVEPTIQLKEAPSTRGTADLEIGPEGTL